jgi:heat shock protein 5
VKKTQTFVTSQDDQEYVRVQIFEGERAMTRDNHFLGAFDLTGLPSGPRGTVQVHVTFELDQNNLLKVTAEDRTSNNKQSITINAQEARLNEEERQEAIKAAEEWAAEDDRARSAANAKNNLDQIVSVAKRDLGKDDVKERLSAEERKELKKTVKEASEWLEANPDEDADTYEEKRKELTQLLAPILQSGGGAPGAPATPEDDDAEDGDDDEEVGDL